MRVSFEILAGFPESKRRAFEMRLIEDSQAVRCGNAHARNYSKSSQCRAADAEAPERGCSKQQSKLEDFISFYSQLIGHFLTNVQFY